MATCPTCREPMLTEWPHVHRARVAADGVDERPVEMVDLIDLCAEQLPRGFYSFEHELAGEVETITRHEIARIITGVLEKGTFEHEFRVRDEWS